MDLTDQVLRRFCIFVLMLSTAWAMVDLHCNVTQTSDGRFKLWLSAPPPSADCRWLWEDVDKTTLAVGFHNFSSQVFSVSEQYLILKNCSNFTRYQRDCLHLDWTEALCSFNCSSVVTPPPPVVPHVRLSGDGLWWMVAASILIMGVIIGSSVYWCRIRRSAKRSHQDQTERMEKEMLKDQDKPPDQMSDVKVPMAEVCPH